MLKLVRVVESENIGGAGHETRQCQAQYAAIALDIIGCFNLLCQRNATQNKIQAKISYQKNWYWCGVFCLYYIIFILHL